MNPNSKVTLDHSFIVIFIFFGLQTVRIIFFPALSFLVFTMFQCPVSSVNCQDLSNHLGILAVRLNELETSLIYNS